MKPDFSVSDAKLRNQTLIDQKVWIQVYLGH